MQRSATKAHLLRALLDFAWNEWAQIGVFGSASGHSPWAQDPEALAVFTLEVGRDDPRLFDEVLDWMLGHESRLSVRRLRAMCADVEDERILEAALSCLHEHGWRTKPRAPVDSELDHEPLFRGLSQPSGEVDPSFARWGLLRPPFRPSGKSRPPDVFAPVNFAFRLRQLLGVGVRSEVARLLLTIDAPSVTAGVVARATGYSQRNVHDTLSALREAGVVSGWTVASVQRYATNRHGWAALLELGSAEFPIHRDWPQILAALREILRFLSRPDLDRLSEYMAGSLTRDLLERVGPDLAYAGIGMPRSLSSEHAWDDLRQTIDSVLLAIRPGAYLENGGQPHRGLEIAERDKDPGYSRWLHAANGEPLATSAESFSTRAGAARAAQNLRDRAGEWDYTVYEDPAGGWLWRARASNGRPVAASPEAFSTRDAAKRATAAVRSIGETEGEIDVVASDERKGVGGPP